MASRGMPPSNSLYEECADCRKTGVPLHANDDPSLPPQALNLSTTKPRFCAQCMLGKKVRVFWPVDKSWYTGVVEKYNDSTGEHLLRYDDNDTEWVKIGEINAANASGRIASPTDFVGPDPAMSPHTDKIDASPIPHGHPGNYVDETPDRRYAPLRGPPQSYQGYGPPSAGPPPGHHMPPHPSQPPMNYGMPAYPPPPSYGQHPPPYHTGPPAPYNYHVPPMVTSSHVSGSHEPRRDGSLSAPNSADKGGKRKAGPKVWTKEEDQILLNMVQSMRMPMKWSIVAQRMPDRTGKQCRERYVNHLNPRLKMSDWNPVEDATIFHLYNTTGSHWAKMSKMIPGRTDNGIKNRFHNLRRQLEREDEHRLRLSKAEDFPEEIRLERLRPFPDHLKGKNDELWDIARGTGVLAAQSVLGGGISRNAGRFGPFRTPENGDLCARCGYMVPSVQTGNELCTKTGWCLSCSRIPPHISGALLRDCLNLRRAEDKAMRRVVESWNELVAPEASAASSRNASRDHEPEEKIVTKTE